MSVVVLSAIDSSDGRDALSRVLSSVADTVHWVDLMRIEFGSCLACGGCAEMPRCVLADEYTPVIADLAACERLILVTPIFLGVHHPVMKRAVDRFMPLGGGPFTVRQGEMHHESRMEHPFSLVGIGLLVDGALPEEADTFRMLIARHAVNLDCPSHEAYVVEDLGDVAPRLSNPLKRGGLE